jgi:hypothetical protein
MERKSPRRVKDLVGRRSGRGLWPGRIRRRHISSEDGAPAATPGRQNAATPTSPRPLGPIHPGGSGSERFGGADHLEKAPKATARGMRAGCAARGDRLRHASPKVWGRVARI